MNPATLKTAFKVASLGWNKFNEYRDEKAREAYDALENAAAAVSDKASDIDAFPRSRKQAGAVTKAAHSRLERAIEELSSRGEEAAADLSDRFDSARKDARKGTKKLSNKAQKKAAKAQKLAAKRLGKDKSGPGFFGVMGILTLLAAIGGAAFYFLRNFVEKETPSTKPPRVEEFGADAHQGSKLVYSSTSQKSDLVEEGVKDRDEDLLGSLEEQLSKHAENASEKVQEVAGQVKEAVQNAADKAADIKDAAADKATEVAKDAADKTKDAAEAVADKADDVKDAAKDAADTAADKAKDAADAAAEKTKDAAETVADKADEGKHRLNENK